jgi:hypothetical protein
MFALKTVLGRRFESRHKLQTMNRPNTGFMPIFRRFSCISNVLEYPYLHFKMQKNHTNAMKIVRIVTRKMPGSITKTDTKLKTIMNYAEGVFVA